MMRRADPRLSARFQAFAAHLEDVQSDEFGDWQLARREPLTKLYPDDVDIVSAAAVGFASFAGSFGGGVLAFDMAAENADDAAVIEFDSEGGITVLRESFDDFLPLLASDVPDTQADSWVAGDELCAWIVASDVRPHPSASARLTSLAARTHATWSRLTRSLREPSGRLRPREPADHRLAFGQ